MFRLNYGVRTNRQFQIVDKCQIASDTILRDRLLLLKSTIYDSIKVNDLLRSHSSLLWPLACFGLICSKGSRQKEKEEDAVTGLLAALSCLEREHLMSAMETVIEGERAIRPGLFVERVQELDNVVSRYLPMFYKRAFHFLRNAPDAEDAVQDALLSVPMSSRARV